MLLILRWGGGSAERHERGSKSLKMYYCRRDASDGRRKKLLFSYFFFYASVKQTINRILLRLFKRMNGKRVVRKGRTRVIIAGLGLKRNRLRRPMLYWRLNILRTTQVYKKVPTQRLNSRKTIRLPVEQISRIQKKKKT